MEKNRDKDGKAFYKLMNNAVNVVFSMENIWSRVYARLVNNKKEYSKKPSKPSFIAQKIFDNDLVSIHKIQTTLTQANQATNQDYYSHILTG